MKKGNSVATKKALAFLAANPEATAAIAAKKFHIDRSTIYKAQQREKAKQVQQ